MGCREDHWVSWPGDVTAPTTVRLLARAESMFALRVGDGPAADWSDLRLEEAMRRGLEGVRGVVDVTPPGWRGGCLSEPDGFVVDVAICAMPLPEIAAHIAGLWSEQSALRDRSSTFCVRLVGASGPRCAASDPACGPQPIDRTASDAGVLPPDSERCPAFTTPSSFQRGRCAHDGECVITGCGNVCVQWSLAPFDYQCPGFSNARWCGCVDGRCAWFFVPP